MRTFLVATLLFFLSTPAVQAKVELIMFNSPACEYCEMWEDEVGIIYDKTDEAKTAPVRRIFIGDAEKSQLKIRPIIYTPTFVLVNQGKEIGRIVGYGGEAFFWGFLEQILKKLPAEANISALDKLSATHVASILKQ